jgi:hypothetical protein
MDVNDLPREPRLDNRRDYGSTKPFLEVKEFLNREVAPLFDILLNESLSDSLRHSIRNYLLVILFAALDYYFRNSARNLTDKNNLNVDHLFPAKFQKKLHRLINENVATKGTIVASTYRFVDIFEIDFVFSNLLLINSFLDYMIKLNDINQTRYVSDGHPLSIEYEEMTKAHRLRNYIAHEIKDVDISKSRIIALWDNLMNIMDLSQSVFMSVSYSNLRSSLDSDYQGKVRAKRKATYKLCSDNIMSKLIGKGQPDYKDIVDEIGWDYGKDNAEWVIQRMLKEELINKNGAAISLISKGEKRYKRTTERNREKWRRELSDITSSWIATCPINLI